MKITKVEAIYLRQPEVKEQCDSGQDALIVLGLADGHGAASLVTEAQDHGAKIFRIDGDFFIVRRL